LFYRNSRRAALTPLGEAMLPHLTRAMQAIDRARAVATLNAEQLMGRDKLLNRGDYSTSFSEP
jgi:DNA-binding transcriptional LysR family regulator